MPANDWDELDDVDKEESNRDRLVEELRDEFDADPDTALERAEDVGIEIDEIAD